MSFVPSEKMSLTQGMGLKTIISLVIMYVASFAVGQEAVQRYFAARDEKAAKLGSLYAGFVYLLFAFIPALLGIIAYSMVQAGAIDGTIIQEQGTKYVLPILVVNVLVGIVKGIVPFAYVSTLSPFTYIFTVPDE